MIHIVLRPMTARSPAWGRQANRRLLGATQQVTLGCPAALLTMSNDLVGTPRTDVWVASGRGWERRG